MPALRAKAAMDAIEQSLRKGRTIRLVHMDRGRPAVEAAVLPAVVGVVTIAPASIHLEPQVLGHPHLRTDMHGAVDVPVTRVTDGVVQFALAIDGQAIQCRDGVDFGRRRHRRTLLLGTLFPLAGFR